MRKKTLFMSIAAIVVLISWTFMGLAFAGPLVLRFKIDPEYNPTIPTSIYYHKVETPDVYNADDQIDPFQSPFDVKQEEEVAINAQNVPTTGLTVWELSQLKLTSVVINGKRKFAAFNTPAGGMCPMGKVGDFIGKIGYRITDIQSGKVMIALGDNSITINAR